MYIEIKITVIIQCSEVKKEALVLLLLRVSRLVAIVRQTFINPLRPNSDLSQTSHCNIKGLSVREVMRIENMITQVQFY